ncbi:MAG: DUF421 domain-containing protein [Oscillospiraceae bacterium]
MAIILIRTIIVFVSITVSLRLMGKRQIGELELSELVVAILISDLASNPLQDIGIPLLNGLIPIVVLLCCELIISGLIMKSVRFRGLICGRPSILVENGVINQKEMRKNRFTIDELSEELRNQGIIDISKIKYAILETDGVLNTVLFPEEQPLTPAQMGISVPDTGYTMIIINDGVVIESNLEKSGHNRKWLYYELKKRGVTKPERVFIMTVNNAGQIYFLPMEGKK